MSVDATELANHRAAQQPPASQQADARKLEADGLVELFEVELRDGSLIYLKNDNEVTWQGNTYEGWHVYVTGVNTSVDEEVSRPQVGIANVEGIFNNYVRLGTLDNALFRRIRILLTDLEADNDVKHTEEWRIRRVAGLNKDMITLELRHKLDGQPFQVPARMYLPPEFKAVRIR